MSDAASGVLARFRFHLPKLPAGRVFNHSGSAGPRRLAAIMLVGAATLAVVLGVVFMGRQQPRLSQDARLMRMDPLPGGLHSTPEQDALGLAANDQEAQAALRKGSSYTPPMAPSQPSSALPPHVDLPVPAAPAPSQPVFVGRAPRPLPRLYTPPADATFPAVAPPVRSEPQMQPIPVAAPAVDQQGQPLYSKQIGDMFSQWGGRVPRTDVIMPPSQGDAGDPPDTSAPSGAGLSSRARSAASAALPVSTRAADQGDILVPAGRGVYAHPVLALSSDQSSPVVLQADSGPLAGDRMIGTFAKQANRLIIHVSTIIHNGENISCDGVVTAPDTMEASVASRVDEHYVSRFLLPAAAAFVNGLGQAIETTSNSVAVLSPLGGATTTNHLNIQQQLGVGAGAAAAQVGQTLNQEAPKGPTVSLEANVAVGVMFLSNVTSHHGE
jgi:intracellular multiplication protein IcmE